MSLSDELASLLITSGATLVGFADLQELPAEDRDNLPFGISFAVALNPEIIADIEQGPTNRYVEECVRVDRLLMELGEIASHILQQKGHLAQPRTTPGPEYVDTLSTRLPHKTVATRAGLGWIGKNALLVTREFGSALRLGSILTNAIISGGTQVNTSRCGDCNECVISCPATTINGEEWHTGIKREDLINAFTCQKTARELLSQRTGGSIAGRTFCGICIAACPWTKQYLKKAGE